MTSAGRLANTNSLANELFDTVQDHILWLGVLFMLAKLL